MNLLQQANNGMLSLEDCKSLWENAVSAFTQNDYLTMYINIPFCRERCNFCLYYRDSFNNHQECDKHVAEVENEIEYFADVLGGYPIRAFYIGGGTPSILTSQQIERLLTVMSSNFQFSVNHDSFRCFEGHPAYLTAKKLDAILRNGFVNRMSFGLQSTNKDVIEASGRFYVSIEKLREVIEYSRAIANDAKLNLNVDLMIGLEKETEESVFRSFDAVAELGVSRIAVYCNRNKELELGDSFRQYAVTLIQKLADHVNNFHSQYSLLNHSAERYNESFAWGANHDIENGLFRHYYNSSPIDYNNNIGIGRGASSHLIPNECMYWNTGSGYQLFSLEEANDRFELVRRNRASETFKSNKYNF